MNRRRVDISWDLARVVMAVLVGAAIIAQLVVSIDSARQHGRDVNTTVTNFFSFFTILSNLSALVLLLCSGILGLSTIRSSVHREPRWLGIAMMASSTYMITTGIVYNVLLRGIELPQGSTVAWSNEVVHLVAPLFMVADLLVAPRRTRPPWSTMWTIIAFPILWIVYTLARGPLVTNPQTRDPWWYPYPFLDPHHVAGGWWGVAGYVVAVAIVITGLAAGVLAVSRRVAARRPAATLDSPHDRNALSSE